MDHDNIKLDLIDFNAPGDTTVGDYVVSIEQDQFAEDPRDMENLGRMVCWANRYNIGDEHGYETPDVFMHVISGLYPETATEDLTENQMTKCYEMAEKKNVILPIYMYVHSIMTINTTGFNCPWDSGQVGYIFVSLNDVRKEFGVSRVSNKLRERIESILRGEVEVCDMYLRGETYYYTITKDDHIIDSCGGFYGTDDMMLYIREALEHEFENNPQQRELEIAV